MINQLFTATALAATLCAGGAAQAALVTFDDPGVVDVDNTTQVATYTEAGFSIMGQAASFLPIDMRLAGGFDPSPFSLVQAGGGDFSLLSLDLDFFDLGFGDSTSTLTITGLLGGSAVASRTVALAGAQALLFDAAWARLSEVSFTGNAGFSLDNLSAVPVASAVPVPGTLALSSLALMALAAMAARRKA